jgi:hypothetical protein
VPSIAVATDTPLIARVLSVDTFSNEKVDIYVDGELQARPKTHWS